MYQPLYLMQFLYSPCNFLLLASFISGALLASVSAGDFTPPRHCLRDSPLSNNLACSSTGTGTGDLVSSIYPQTSSQIQVDFNPEFFPWTYEPICTPRLKSVGTKICVYTNASFSDGRGVSIFTTPKIAKRFATLPPFQDPAALNGINRREDGQSPWYTQQLEGKGVGMLASRRLNRKDLVTAYTPVLIVYMEQELSMLEKERLLRIAINQLPPPTRKAYLGLSTIYGDPDLVVQDILKANTFEIEVGGEMHLALIPETSRINHACGPNSQYYFDADLFTHFVHATRPIAKGEEITISYTDPFNPHSDRQEHLLSSFHFTCHCPRCTAGQTSDAILTKIDSLRQSLSDWEPTSTATVQQAKELIKTFRDDGLDAFLDVAYGHAVLTYSALGDVKNTRKYAKLAAEAVRMTNGPHAQDFRLWNEVMERPEEHWSWRYRMQ